MSPDALRGLRSRLTLYVAAVLAVAVAVPTVAVCTTRADQARERLDARIAGAVRDVDLTLSESEQDAGELDLEIYTGIPRPAGAPLTAVLDPDGAFLAGDREIPAAVRRRVVALADAGDDGVVAVGDVRVAARGVQGAEDELGIAVAFASTGPTDDEIRDDTLLVIALALGGWLLASGLSVVLVARALAPAGAAARREQAFLADAAHELRTPWAIVRGRAEQALRYRPTDEDLQVITATATTAADGITDMLELARLDAGQAMGEREPVALDALVDTCVGEREEEAARRGVRVVRAAAPRTVVLGDERLLARAVGNLLDNALRHGGVGGLLEVAVRADGAEAVVEVADRGPGVAPGQRERIFDRFHRGSSAGPGGAGLGLPIAALVASAHGGTLELAPPAADGTPGARFLLRVPVQP